MKLAVRRTNLGDRLCFPEAVQGRLVDVQAAYAHQLQVDGTHRDDAITPSNIRRHGEGQKGARGRLFA